MTVTHPPPYDYDLIVIGSGPAGEMAAVEAGYLGKKVALIEKENVLGGAATNTGTLPSKTLRETALFLAGFRQRALFGLDLSIATERITAREFLYRERHVAEKEREKIRARLDAQHVQVITGTAAFESEHVLSISSPNADPHRVSGAVILIATGSRPFRPPIFPTESPRVFDSDSILHIAQLPKSMLIVGAGVIGCEYASIFACLGIAVSLVNSSEVLLPFLDTEVQDLLEKALVASGVRMIKSERVASVSETDASITATMESGTALSADCLLLATGRSSNTDGLGLENTGVELGKRGLITVDPHYQTTNPDIYAAGDVIGFPSLASTSIGQARIAIEHAFRADDEELAPVVLPYGIYTIPECAMAGEIEDQLRSRGADFVVGKARYSDNARGLIIGEEFGLLKLYFERNTRRLLGVHIIGEQATELVHLGVVALSAVATADVFLRPAFNYPTLSELYKHAAYDAFGKPSID
ncbi:MAG: Si-specific NAD(P)(+) transhydrogenase [Verrucomicrobiae bacterium]|nr:Si-specific NAD(P)(+) transhydrogenase [Verrucomicrobiae bacterium]